MNRRVFLANSICLAAGATAAPLAGFKLGAISDGFSQNFEEALKIMGGYGLSWVEIRKVFGVYNTETSPAQVGRLKELLDQYKFRVSVIDSALYKCTLPGTKPVAAQKDAYPYPEQMELLKRAADRAHALRADKIRGFTFWRVGEPGKLSQRIAEELSKAAETAKSLGMRLVIENEESCNAATGGELAQILTLAPAGNLGVNWDIGNGYSKGEVSFPDGYRLLDKKRIWHLHLKGMKCGPGLKNCRESIAGESEIDLAGQFRQLRLDGYQETMSLECELEVPGQSRVETSKRSLNGLLQVLKTVAG